MEEEPDSPETAPEAEPLASETAEAEAPVPEAEPLTPDGEPLAPEAEPPASEAPADESLPAEPDSPWPRRLRVASIIVGVTIVLWLLLVWITWPDVGALRTENPETTAFIEMYRASQRDAGRSDEVAWSPVPYARISPNLKRAVVASEDSEFFFHDGFSSHEMKEALKKAIREREAPRGASTITQQVAKNLWLSPRRSLTRKLREAILTKQLEKELSKARILELHLNIAEFGPGIYGAEAAARHYFGLPASGLSPRQGAMLAAGLPRPKRWNPSSDSDYYRSRVEQILDVERRLEYLDRYIGPEQPGSLNVQPPEVPSPLP